ncbi:MAG: hypothetical protein ACTSUE_03190 [Promethearchaeota archaeon]
MKLSSKQVATVQLVLVGFVLSSYFVTVSFIRDPSDFLPERLARSDRKGMMYGYVFLSWEDLMNSGVEGEYMDLVAQCLDFCYVQAQWSVCGLDNDTLDQNYLGNLTSFISGLGIRGVKVIIHIWVSSYSPSWMNAYTPELIGQDDRWPGIDPGTTNSTMLEHRNALKWSMIRYQELLCQYFIDEGVGDDIMGFCLDDETQSENWNDFFANLTTTIHSFNSTWETMAMFNRIDKYHVTGEAGMDVNAMDPYDQDMKFIQKITYAYQHSGVDKISVLIDAMCAHDDITSQNKMRRQAWIAWFMGADSIGWYTFLYGTDKWACALSRWASGLGPGITNKTQTTIETAIDIRKLNQAYNHINGTIGFNDGLARLEDAYLLAKQNRFTQARTIIDEVIAS